LATVFLPATAFFLLVLAAFLGAAAGLASATAFGASAFGAAATFGAATFGAAVFFATFLATFLLAAGSTGSALAGVDALAPLPPFDAAGLVAAGLATAFFWVACVALFFLVVAIGRFRGVRCAQAC
jgi:hypothetical protein